MILNSLQLIYPDLATRYLLGKDEFHQRHPDLVLKEVETLRTMEQQMEYWNQGRSSPGKIITRSYPGQSWHQFGLALDVAFEGNDPYLKKIPIHEANEIWKSMGEIMKSHGIKWGGDFTKIADMDHLEDDYGFTLTQANKLIQLPAGVMAVWNAIDQQRKCGTLIT